MKLKRIIALLCITFMVISNFILPLTTVEAKEVEHEGISVSTNEGKTDTTKMMVDSTEDGSVLADEETSEVPEKEEPEAKVFEEPENYNLRSMNLKATEVAEVEDGGTSGNDLFDFEAFIKESDIKDGTAPFDKDDQAGNDSGANNGVVRTFDTVTYPIKITVNPKKVDKLNNIVLKITGTLENGISDNQVNAKFSVGGYEDIEKNIVGFEQFYTIEQTGNSIMVPINIDVQGAKNGVNLTPKLNVEVISVDGVDISKDNVSMKFGKLSSVKTSGKVNIKAYAGKHNYGSNRFLTVPYAVLDPNTEKDTNIFGFFIAMGIQKLDGKTDMRGATFPTGKINYHVDLNGYVAWDGGNLSGKSENLKFTGKDTPLYMMDQQPIVGITQKNGNENTLLNGVQYSFPYPTGYPTARSKMTSLKPETINKEAFFSVWDSGTWKISKPIVSSDKVTYQGTMENYLIGSTFPEYRADGWTGGKQYGVNDKIFATNSFMVEQPNEYVVGENNNKDGIANNVYYEANVTIDSYIDESGKEISLNKTAKAISSERNNPSGSMLVQNTFLSYPGGQQLGTPNIGDGTVSKGDASTILNTDVYFRGYARSSIINYGGYDLVLRWNTDSFELTREYAQKAYNNIMTAGYENNAGKFVKNNTDKQKVYYGIAKFTDNSFASFTAKGDNDYTWYENYAEAMKHGPIGAIKSAVNDVIGASSFTSWQFPLHVKTTKIGSFNEKDTANVAVTNLYSYPSKDRSKRIDVSEGKSYQTPSIWDDLGNLEKKQSPVGNSVNFETLAILNIETSSSITADKPTYYNSETVNWTIKSSVVLPPTGAPDGFDGSVEVKQILPKGLDYKTGSGKQGKIAKEPKIIKNSDGTTTLIWDLLVSKDTIIEDVTYSTTINPFALSSGGVQSSLTVKNIVSSPLDTRRENLRTSTQTINILKVGMVGIYENINKQYGEKNSEFSLMLQPYTTIEEEFDVKGITILPQNKDKIGSSYSGTALLKKVTVSGDNPVSVYLNNNVVENSNPQKIDLKQGGWYKYTGAGQNVSNAKTVLFHVEGVLANDDNVEIKLDMQTNNNKFGDTYLNETTINSATDYKLSPISNKVRYTIRADVELNLERIQIYTANHKEGLPVKVRVDKEVIKNEAINESLKLVLYDKEKNKKVFEKDFTVNQLQRENELIIPSEFLEKDHSNSYEVRIEGYNDNRVYVLEGANKVDTLGYTASEKKLVANVSTDVKNSDTLDYKGVIMTEREVGKDMVEFYESLSLPTIKLDSVKSGYGVDLNKTVSYSNELNNVKGIKAKMIVDNRLIDSYLEYPEKGTNVSIDLYSEEESVNGNKMKQTLTMPNVYVEEKTGALFSEDQKESKDSRIKYTLKDGGSKLYTPIWIDELGSYGVSFQSTDPIGANEVTFDISDTVDIKAYMYGHIGSETIDQDEILIEPVDINNPFPEGLPKNWTTNDLKWLQK